MTIELDAIIYICGFITTVAAACGIIYKISKTFIDKSVSAAIDKVLNTALDKQSKDIDDKLKGFSDKLDMHIEEAKENDSVIMTSIMRTIRDRINQAYDIYPKIGKIDSHTMYVLEELYISYSELGGNSFTKRQMEILRSLEITTGSITDINDNETYKE